MTETREIYSADKVCWNCDNFVRNEYDYFGTCIVAKSKKARRNDSNCKKFVERLEER